MADEVKPENLNDEINSEEETKKKATRKGISITIALVMLGFDDWKDLEPGSFYLQNPKLTTQFI